jgi:hypothetical protein
MVIGNSETAHAETDGSGGAVCLTGQIADIGTTQCVAMPRKGPGFDLESTGSSREEQCRFNKSVAAEDQQ